MKNGLILGQMLRERRRATLWWSLAIAALVLITAASYPSVKEAGSAFDQLVEQMPEGLLEMMGAADGLTTPAGYLNSQLYSNVLPIVLLIFGISAAAWTVAGSEREGTLEPLLANPVHRWQVAIERLTGTTLLLAVLTLVATVLLVAFRSPFELDELSVADLTAAGTAAFLLSLLFSGITYATGAATGSKGWAIAAGAGLATATYVLFGLSSLVDLFESLRWASPWYWFLQPSPLSEGWTFQAIGVPLLVVVPVIAAGTVVFTRRDLT
ncbi:ABC transporter permease subunit [Phytoactinopolyspora halotolerans]|uniref:ABC transporter permease subunit n=1 Tax=Phytoactinopolyspora halotolerans TaxID=1981512 RepID=A0A6L9S5D6_9ACTN|nr:ABC transporter permease subunit [Phytoactinopolyspora halotolerans]NED99960.1 ABC transporter permease subunit [Phytoactinopolyspora halotolerans]